MKMNRIDDIFSKKDGLLSIYVTAGYPRIDDTTAVLKALDKAGIDMVEIGMPFSDPLADGPVIQKSSLEALKNGMCIKTLMKQLDGIRKDVNCALLLMGYINPVMHYGMEKFVNDCVARGIDGVILPDLPWEVYIAEYKALFEKAGLHFVPLIAPQTPDERIRKIDSEARGFIYMVASPGTTGNIKTTEDYRTRYFERIRALGLRNKLMIGFGVKDAAGYRHACAHANGAIIGTAFVNHLRDNGADEASIASFVKNIKA